MPRPDIKLREIFRSDRWWFNCKKKKDDFFTDFSRVAPDTGGRMADRNEAAPPFHPRPRVPPGSRQHTLTGGNVIFRGKTSFSGVNGKLPLSSGKSWDSWWNFRIWSFFFFITQDNTIERDVRFSKYLKFRVYFWSLRSRYRKVHFAGDVYGKERRVKY